jgi:hypothetical protein
MQKWNDIVVCLAAYIRQDPQTYTDVYSVKEALSSGQFNSAGLPNISLDSLAELLWAISQRSYI